MEDGISKCVEKKSVIFFKSWHWYLNMVLYFGLGLRLIEKENATLISLLEIGQRKLG